MFIFGREPRSTATSDKFFLKKKNSTRGQKRNRRRKLYIFRGEINGWDWLARRDRGRGFLAEKNNYLSLLQVGKWWQPIMPFYSFLEGSVSLLLWFISTKSYHRAKWRLCPLLFVERTDMPLWDFDLVLLFGRGKGRPSLYVWREKGYFIFFYLIV